MLTFTELLQLVALEAVQGNVFCVDSYSGNDGASGDWKHPLQTTQEAIDRCSGVTNDYVVLYPSINPYDDDPVAAASLDTGKVKRLVNAAVYLNKPNVHIIAMQEKGQQSVVVKPSAAASAGTLCLGASADNCSIQNLTIVNTTNDCLDIASGVANLVLKGCAFIGATIGVDADAGDCTRLQMIDCYFEDCATYGATINASKGVIKDNVFVNPAGGSGTMLYITGNAPSEVSGNCVNGLATAAVGIGVNNVDHCVIHDNKVISCTDNISIGSGTGAGIIWSLTNNAGQGAAAMGSITITA